MTDSTNANQFAKKQRILTGITTTGIPHLGNYVGAIRPAIDASKADDVDAYFFGGLARTHQMPRPQSD